MRNEWAGKRLVVDGTSAHGRALAMAKALGVSHATVSRWRQGSRMSGDYWSAAEEFLGLEPGTFAALDRRTPADDVSDLQDEVIRLTTMVEEIYRRLDTLERRRRA